MLSDRTKAHFPGIRFLAQISGFVWRQPTVCFSVSFAFSGSWNAVSFLIAETLYTNAPTESRTLSIPSFWS